MCVALPAAAFETTAAQAIIVDHETGVVLYSHNADVPMVPASMTKIMTAYMVFERLADGRLPVSYTHLTLPTISSV